MKRFCIIFAAFLLTHSDTYMPSSAQNEQLISNIKKSDIAVLRHINRFPAPNNTEFVSPCLVISINNKGTARAVYDIKEVTFKKNDIAVVMPNHLLCPLYNSEDYDVTLIVASEQFIEELRHRILSYDYSKFHIAPASVLTDEQMLMLQKVVDVIELISTMTEKTLPHRREILIYQLNTIFELINSFRREQDTAVFSPRNESLFNDFCNLLAANYRHTHEVAFYAEQLHLTPKYFSKVVLQTVGVTAGEWIEQYIITQAKNILTTRKDMAVQQVAYYLGFNELSAFSRYFKRATGITPSRYAADRLKDNK